jgi:hypothetical protein
MHRSAIGIEGGFIRGSLGGVHDLTRRQQLSIESSMLPQAGQLATVVELFLPELQLAQSTRSTITSES